MQLKSLWFKLTFPLYPSCQSRLTVGLVRTRQNCNDACFRQQTAPYTPFQLAYNSAYCGSAVKLYGWVCCATSAYNWQLYISFVLSFFLMNRNQREKKKAASCLFRVSFSMLVLLEFWKHTFPKIKASMKCKHRKKHKYLIYSTAINIHTAWSWIKEK